MASIETDNESFKCRQVKDCAVITTRKRAKGMLTTIGLKEEMISILKTIEASPKIKGIALIYSDHYPGDSAYKDYICELLDTKSVEGRARSAMTYRVAITQFYKRIINYPKPIVVGMTDNIGPDSLGISLACDFRIATEKTIIMNPNLKMGLPPSGLLSFFLVQSLGPVKATELMLTKTTFSAHEALDLGLISQLTPEEELEAECIKKLEEFGRLSSNAILRTRKLLLPDVSVIENHMDEVFQSALSSSYQMQT